MVDVCGDLRGGDATPPSAAITDGHHGRVLGRLGWSHELLRTESLFSGLWSLEERSAAHINLLELRAVFLMLRRV